MINHFLLKNNVNHPSYEFFEYSVVIYFYIFYHFLKEFIERKGAEKKIDFIFSNRWKR